MRGYLAALLVIVVLALVRGPNAYAVGLTFTPIDVQDAVQTGVYGINNVG